jgi:hypothetical protein
MVTHTKQGLAHISANQSITEINSAETKLVPSIQLNPAPDAIQGAWEALRWMHKKREEKRLMDMHKDSFKRFGILGAFPVIKVPSTVILNLDGRPFEYKKGTYITVDYSGRLRTIKEMEESGNYKFSELLIADSSKTILNGATEIGEEELQNMWDATVTLSTGGLQWKLYEFIHSGAEVITNPKQKEIFTYCKKMLNKYSKKSPGQLTMTNNNVVNAILGKLPSDTDLRKKTLNYDMRFKRYTDTTLEKLDELRKDLTRANLPSTFVDGLGKYIKDSAIRGYFIGCEYNSINNKWVRDDNTETECFPMSNGTIHDLYTDEHHTEFENSLTDVINAIERDCPIQDGYPSDLSGAKRLIEMNVYKGHKYAN